MALEKYRRLEKLASGAEKTLDAGIKQMESKARAQRRRQRRRRRHVVMFFLAPALSVLLIYLMLVQYRNLGYQHIGDPETMFSVFLYEDTGSSSIVLCFFLAAVFAVIWVVSALSLLAAMLHPAKKDDAAVQIPDISELKKRQKQAEAEFRDYVSAGNGLFEKAMRTDPPDMELLREAAEHGHDEACALVGKYDLERSDSEKAARAARDYLKFAAENGDVEANLLLGKSCIPEIKPDSYDGEAVRNAAWQSALPYLDFAAEAGDREAQLLCLAGKFAAVRTAERIGDYHGGSVTASACAASLREKLRWRGALQDHRVFMEGLLKDAERTAARLEAKYERELLEATERIEQQERAARERADADYGYDLASDWGVHGGDN